MSKTVVAVAATAVIVSAGLLLSDRAQAGASASAPTKYSAASSSSYASWLRTRRFQGSSEYSSSNNQRRR
jgi:hypothetical protein